MRSGPRVRTVKSGRMKAASVRRPTAARSTDPPPKSLTALILPTAIPEAGEQKPETGAVQMPPSAPLSGTFPSNHRRCLPLACSEGFRTHRELLACLYITLTTPSSHPATITSPNQPSRYIGVVIHSFCTLSFGRPNYIRATNVLCIKLILFMAERGYDSHVRSPFLRMAPPSFSAFLVLPDLTLSSPQTKY